MRDNLDVRVRFAETADRVISSPLRRLHVMEIYRETWQRAPERIELGIRAGDIGIDLNRFDEAVAIADQLDAANLANPDRGDQGQSGRRPHQGARPFGASQRARRRRLCIGMAGDRGRLQ